MEIPASHKETSASQRDPTCPINAFGTGLVQVVGTDGETGDTRISPHALPLIRSLLVVMATVVNVIVELDHAIAVVNVDGEFVKDGGAEKT